MKLIAILLVIAAVACARSYHSDWIDYKEKYNKSYEDSENLQRIFIFLESKKKVEKHNKKFMMGNISYALGINHLSDMTKEEKQQYVNCLDTKTIRTLKMNRTQYKRRNVTVPDE